MPQLKPYAVSCRPINCLAYLETPMRSFVVAIMLSIASNTCLADDSEKQANSFIRAYAALCLKHLTNLEGLRSTLADLPKLPPEKSKHFLQGQAGDVWPVPNPYGEIVLALLQGKDVCLLYARKVDALRIETGFTKILKNSPAPLVSKLVQDESMDTAANGPVHTTSYEWSKPDANIAMLFTLSTATANDAKLQAMASAALIRK